MKGSLKSGDRPRFLRPVPLKILGVIGDPISHSLSPKMHNAMIAELGLNYIYLPFRVTPKELGTFIRKMRRWKLRGINVTIPHKEKIIRHLDFISKEAKEIGAVNTVVNRGGGLHGHNTDWMGYINSLKFDAKTTLKKKRVAILGAGGAARAILYASCKEKAASVSILNPTSSENDRCYFNRMKRLAGQFSKKFRKTKIELFSLTPENLKDILPSTDILINATPVGLKNTRFKNLPLPRLPKKALVSDLVYNPRWTPLLKSARRLGYKTHSGMGMLIHQGVLSLNELFLSRL